MTSAVQIRRKHFLTLTDHDLGYHMPTGEYNLWNLRSNLIHEISDPRSLFLKNYAILKIR